MEETDAGQAMIKATRKREMSTEWQFYGKSKIKRGDVFLCDDVIFNRIQKKGPAKVTSELRPE